MGFWASVLGLEEPAAVELSVDTAAPRHRFTAPAIGSDYQTWLALVGNTYATGKVTRDQAMRVPGLKRARDLLCSLAALPLHAYRESTGERVEHQLLVQPESLKGLVRSVTLARTIEDLFYEASSLWLVIQRSASTGFPTAVERIQHGNWTQDADFGQIRVRGNEVNPEDAILFVSPNDPMLHAAAATVRMAIRLEATAELYADSPEAAEYFVPSDGQELEDEDVQAFLTSWNTARKTRATGYLPAGIERREIKRMTPEELSLAGSRDFLVKELSRLTGTDADMLSVNTTTRTYQNLQDARRAYLDGTAMPYLRAIEERLSLPDATPRGHTVRFSLDGFLRANTLERMQAYQIGAQVGAYTTDEIRDLEDRPPLTQPVEPVDA